MTHSSAEREAHAGSETKKIIPSMSNPGCPGEDLAEVEIPYLTQGNVTRAAGLQLPMLKKTIQSYFKAIGRLTTKLITSLRPTIIFPPGMTN